MNRRLILMLACMCLCVRAAAEVQPAVLNMPESEIWTGQRLRFFVELRSRGSFSGAASFSLPRIPKTVILKVSNPVVSSKDIEGESWFIQQHEFALFSQANGRLQIPEFEVRFGRRDGFTGPVLDVKALIPAAEVTIKRPPSSEQFGFLITCNSIEISEVWEPSPGPAKLGAVFTRTISQKAVGMTGMALMPPPISADDGIRVYPEPEQIRDNTNRGDFTGERVDKMVYLMREPGTRTLPAITYAWWDPSSKKIFTKTLPAVTFEVAAPPTSATSTASSESPEAKLVWLFGIAAMLVVVVWQRSRLTGIVTRLIKIIWNPERNASRMLRWACCRSDAASANAAWLQWRSLQGSELESYPGLKTAVNELQATIYRNDSDDHWNGESLGRAFKQQLAMAAHDRRQSNDHSSLRPMNPVSCSGKR